MASRGKIEKWLFAEWSSGRVVNSRSMVKVEHEVSKVGPATSGDANQVRDSNENVSNGRCLPEEVQRVEQNEEGGPSIQQENMDFSSSASSWEPSDDNESSEESEEEDKRAKLNASTRQYCNKRGGKKGPVPAHRPNAIIPNVLQARQTNSLNGKRRYKYIDAHRNDKRESVKSLPDSTRKGTPPNDSGKGGRVESVSVNVKDILEIKASFRELFQLLNDLKPQTAKRASELNRIQLASNNDTAGVSDGESDRSHSVESNRSDDNVLITNKYDKAVVRRQESGGGDEEEWIPIGSGKTLIHKDKYRKVNWRSYTIATRTLLLATFPRRILATHSLTGKRSPAFQDKPAKMCLDPKIVSDVIIEITSRFKVKENLVRSIITTKCADECKMYKLRLKQKGKQAKDSENARSKEEAGE
ncbi:unnamed protein product, partial [Iphiclides podalirius]